MRLRLHQDSHLDHGVDPEVVAQVIKTVEYGSGLLIKTVDVDQDVSCNLYGPIMGDEAYTEDDVYYESRGDREYPSRMVHAPARSCRQVTVIAGPHDGERAVIYTMFGGPLAPKEPQDPSLRPDELEKSREFWSAHALADGEG